MHFNLQEKLRGGAVGLGMKRKERDLKEGIEPRSVLDHRRSPSPPTSSSSFGGAAGKCPSSDDWDLAPVPASLDSGEVWETMLSGPANPLVQDQTFIQYMFGDDTSLAIKPQLLTQTAADLAAGSPTSLGFGLLDPCFAFDPAPSSSPVSTPFPSMAAMLPSIHSPALSPPMALPQAMSQNPSFSPELPQQLPLLLKNPFQPQPKPKPADGDEQQALVDQLFMAARLFEAGNFVGARWILARLNHLLPSSATGNPLLRSVFYFRNALDLLLSVNPSPTPLATPLDVVLKLSAYKVFSEVSPIMQFTNFTSIQAILEQLGSADRIHIVDFDIGSGAQWATFMLELAQLRRSAGASCPMLKITAFSSMTSSLYPPKLHLTREHLYCLATELNIPFEFHAISLQSFNSIAILGMSKGYAFAVNLSVSSGFGASVPVVLQLVKQLSPKIVVSIDQGCDRSDLPFSQHFLHALQSSIVLLDSIDAAGTSMDEVNKIERFLVQPRIERVVLGRHLNPDNMLPWRTLFRTAGYVPLQFSNYAEMQAEYLLEKVHVKGYHVEKRQSSLFLYWQHGELVSVSAWKC